MSGEQPTGFPAQASILGSAHELLIPDEPLEALLDGMPSETAHPSYRVTSLDDDVPWDAAVQPGSMSQAGLERTYWWARIGSDHARDFGAEQSASAQFAGGSRCSETLERVSGSSSRGHSRRTRQPVELGRKLLDNPSASVSSSSSLLKESARKALRMGDPSTMVRDSQLSGNLRKDVTSADKATSRRGLSYTHAKDKQDLLNVFEQYQREVRDLEGSVLSKAAFPDLAGPEFIDESNASESPSISSRAFLNQEESRPSTTITKVPWEVPSLPVAKAMSSVELVQKHQALSEYDTSISMLPLPLTEGEERWLDRYLSSQTTGFASSANMCEVRLAELEEPLRVAEALDAAADASKASVMAKELVGSGLVDLSFSSTSGVVDTKRSLINGPRPLEIAASFSLLSKLVVSAQLPPHVLQEWAHIFKALRDAIYVDQSGEEDPSKCRETGWYMKYLSDEHIISDLKRVPWSTVLTDLHNRLNFAAAFSRAEMNAGLDRAARQAFLHRIVVERLVTTGHRRVLGLVTHLWKEDVTRARSPARAEIVRRSQEILRSWLARAHGHRLRDAFTVWRLGAAMSARKRAEQAIYEEELMTRITDSESTTVLTELEEKEQSVEKLTLELIQLTSELAEEERAVRIARKAADLALRGLFQARELQATFAPSLAESLVEMTEQVHLLSNPMETIIPSLQLLLKSEYEQDYLPPMLLSTGSRDGKPNDSKTDNNHPDSITADQGLHIPAITYHALNHASNDQTASYRSSSASSSVPSRPGSSATQRSATAAALDRPLSGETGPTDCDPESSRRFAVMHELHWCEAIGALQNALFDEVIKPGFAKILTKLSSQAAQLVQQVEQRSKHGVEAPPVVAVGTESGASNRPGTGRSDALGHNSEVVDDSLPIHGPTRAQRRLSDGNVQAGSQSSRATVISPFALAHPQQPPLPTTYRATSSSRAGGTLHSQFGSDSGSGLGPGFTIEATAEQQLRRWCNRHIALAFRLQSGGRESAPPEALLSDPELTFDDQTVDPQTDAPKPSLYDMSSSEVGLAELRIPAQRMLLHNSIMLNLAAFAIARAEGRRARQKQLQDHARMRNVMTQNRLAEGDSGETPKREVFNSFDDDISNEEPDSIAISSESLPELAAELASITTNDSASSLAYDPFHDLGIDMEALYPTPLAALSRLPDDPDPTALISVLVALFCADDFLGAATNLPATERWLPHERPHLNTLLDVTQYMTFQDDSELLYVDETERRMRSADASVQAEKATQPDSSTATTVLPRSHERKLREDTAQRGSKREVVDKQMIFTPNPERDTLVRERLLMRATTRKMRILGAFKQFASRAPTPVTTPSQSFRYPLVEAGLAKIENTVATDRGLSILTAMGMLASDSQHSIVVDSLHSAIYAVRRLHDLVHQSRRQTDLFREELRNDLVAILGAQIRAQEAALDVAVPGIPASFKFRCSANLIADIPALARVNSRPYLEYACRRDPTKYSVKEVHPAIRRIEHVFSRCSRTLRTIFFHYARSIRSGSSLNPAEDVSPATGAASPSVPGLNASPAQEPNVNRATRPLTMSHAKFWRFVRDCKLGIRSSKLIDQIVHRVLMRRSGPSAPASVAIPEGGVAPAMGSPEVGGLTPVITGPNTSTTTGLALADLTLTHFHEVLLRLALLKFAGPLMKLTPAPPPDAGASGANAGQIEGPIDGSGEPVLASEVTTSGPAVQEAPAPEPQAGSSVPSNDVEFAEAEHAAESVAAKLQLFLAQYVLPNASHSATSSAYMQVRFVSYMALHMYHLLSPHSPPLHLPVS